MVYLSPCKRTFKITEKNEFTSALSTGYQGISILARDLLASLHKKKRNVYFYLQEENTGLYFTSRCE